MMLDFSGYFYYVNQLELKAKFRSLTNLVVHLFTFCFAIDTEYVCVYYFYAIEIIGFLCFLLKATAAKVTVKTLKGFFSHFP